MERVTSTTTYKNSAIHGIAEDYQLERHIPLAIVQTRKVSKKQTLKIKAEVVNNEKIKCDLQQLTPLVKFNKKTFSKAVTKQSKVLPIVHKQAILLEFAKKSKF